MQSRYIKILISIVLIVALCLSVTISNAFAQDPFSALAIGGLTGISGAGLFATMAQMSGINFTWTNVNSMDALWSSLSPHPVIWNGVKHVATNVGEDIYDWVQVNLTDWLDTQETFIDGAVDAYNITDNSSGSSGTVTSFNGIPINLTKSGYNNWLFSAVLASAYVSNGQTSFSLAGSGFSVAGSLASGTWTFRYTYNGTSVGTSTTTQSAINNVNLNMIIFKNDVNQVKIGVYRNSENAFIGNSNSLGNSSSGSTIWTSGTVNTGVYNGWESAKIKLPTSSSGLDRNWDMEDFMDAVNEYWENSQQSQIQIEDTGVVPPAPLPTTPLGEIPFDEWQDLYGQHVTGELQNVNQGLQTVSDGIDDLINVGTGGNNQNNQNWHDFRADFAVTAAVIAAIWQWLQNTLNRSITEIERIVSTISSSITQGISDVITGIQTQTSSITQAISDVITQIKTAIQTGVSNITSTITGIGQDIITSISTAVSNIVSGITSSITSAVTSLGNIISGGFQDIISDIEKAGIELFDKALKSIKRIFMPILLLIKQGLGIWHYVVTWFGNISAPFTWTLGMMAGTSSIMLSPIYACVAGALVIAVYKRFGR